MPSVSAHPAPGRAIIPRVRPGPSRALEGRELVHGLRRQHACSEGKQQRGGGWHAVRGSVSSRGSFSRGSRASFTVEARTRGVLCRWLQVTQCHYGVLKLPMFCRAAPPKRPRITRVLRMSIRTQRTQFEECVFLSMQARSLLPLVVHAGRIMVICSPLSGFLALWSSHCQVKNRQSHR